MLDISSIFCTFLLYSIKTIILLTMSHINKTNNKNGPLKSKLKEETYKLPTNTAEFTEAIETKTKVRPSLTVIRP